MSSTPSRLEQATASRKVMGSVLAGILLVAALLVWQAPVEQTLGSGIKVVYVHVALVWTGTLWLVGAGVIGLARQITDRGGLTGWLDVVGKVGFGLYALATVVSLWAEVVNWGGILWDEPRTSAMLQVLAVAVIVQVLHAWLKGRARAQGALHILLAAFLLLRVQVAGLIFHPSDAIGASDATAIRLTFYSLFVLCVIAGLWLTGYVRTTQRND
jgi:hypothetical protein